MKFCSIFLIFTAILTIAAEVEETQKKQGEEIQKIKQKGELLEYELHIPDQEAKNTKEPTFVGNKKGDLVSQKRINEKGNQMGNENKNKNKNHVQKDGNTNVHQKENQNGKEDQTRNTKTDQENTKIRQGDLVSQKINKLGNQNDDVDQDLKQSQKTENKKPDQEKNQNRNGNQPINPKTPQEKSQKDKCKNASNCNLEKQKVEQKWRIKYLKKRISSLKRENKKLKRKLDVVGPFVEFFKIIPTLSYHTIQYILCHRAVNFDEFLKLLNQWS